ncbi:MAG: TetR/AcrR family transcriptional regulator [bacterium]|nr:TetR/AcrR family transcriptional regulator [bacterium]
MISREMKTVSRGKAREMRVRDDLYMEVAQRLILSEGFHNVSLGRIASETGFSKATIYQRFSCKEELIVELGCRLRRDMNRMMRRGAEYNGTPRERLLAMGEAIRFYSKVWADNVRLLDVIDTETVIAKVPEHLQASMADLDVELFGLLKQPVYDAIESGDLVLPTGCSPSTLCFALWTMIDGWGSAVAGTAQDDIFELDSLIDAVLHNCQMLFDGYGWRPLSTEWDYESVFEKVREILAEDSDDVVASEATGLGHSDAPLEVGVVSGEGGDTERS